MAGFMGRVVWTGAAAGKGDGAGRRDTRQTMETNRTNVSLRLSDQTLKLHHQLNLSVTIICEDRRRHNREKINR
jgi:hypothetical protein